MPNKPNKPQATEMQDFRTTHLRALAEKLADMEIERVRQGDMSRLMTQRIATTKIELPDKGKLVQEYLESPGFLVYTANMESEELQKLVQGDLKELRKAIDDKKQELEKAQKAKEEAQKKAEEEQKAKEEEQKKLEEEQKAKEEEQKKAEEEQKAKEEEQKKAEEEQKAKEEEQKKLEEEQKAKEEEQKAQEEAAKQEEAMEEETLNAAPFFSALEKIGLGLAAVYVTSELAKGLRSAFSATLEEKGLQGKEFNMRPGAKEENIVKDVPMTAEELKANFQKYTEESGKMLEAWDKQLTANPDLLSSDAFADDAAMALKVQVLGRMAQQGIEPNSLEGAKMMLAAEIALDGSKTFSNKQEFLCHPDKFLNTVDLIAKSPSFESFTAEKTVEQMQDMPKYRGRSVYQDFLDEMEVTKQKKLGLPEKEARKAAQVIKDTAKLRKQWGSYGLSAASAEAIAIEKAEMQEKGMKEDKIKEAIRKKHPEYVDAMKKKKEISQNEKLDEMTNTLVNEMGVSKEKANRIAKDARKMLQSGKSVNEANKALMDKYPEVKKATKQIIKKQKQEKKNAKVIEDYKKKQLTMQKNAPNKVAAV